jgi:selenocysteine lyase/cysteine desulfurase
MDLTSIREEFPVTNNFIFLNHAAVSPISKRSASAVKRFLKDALYKGTTNYNEWIDQVKETRKAFARLIHATPDEIAFVKNTTEGIVLVANGIPWHQGENIITAAIEFPSNVYPWWNLAPLGIETRMVNPKGGRILYEDIVSLVDEKTRLISLSFVEFSNGFRNDLKRVGGFCRKHGIYFCVDAIQGLGVLDLDVGDYHIDFLSADGHKWLLSPEGCGGFYCAKRVMEKLSAKNVGWHSVINDANYLDYDLTLKPSAQRFEEGSLNIMGIFALGAALDMILEVGIKKIEERIIFLTDLIIQGLREKDYEILSSLILKERSGIVSFRSTSLDATEIYKKLLRAKIIISVRDGALRVSPHFYNTEEEIGTFLETLP